MSIVLTNHKDSIDLYRGHKSELRSMSVRTPFDYVLHSETILHDLHSETNQHIRNTPVRLAN